MLSARMLGHFDRVVARAARHFTDSRIETPSVSLLHDVRVAAAKEVRERHRVRAAELAGRMDEGDREAAEAYGALAERALGEMRAEVLARASLPIRIVAGAHARFGDTDATEHLDDPAFDHDARVRLLAYLDSLNTILGSYRAFFLALEPLLSRERPTRILDLAAGHGGFALAAMRMARERGLDLEITATDLRAEYLALGEEAARREDLRVRFEVQDALDLSNVARGAYDVVLCTQSIHHFPPSMVARVFRESTRVAGRGVALIDGARSVTHAMLVPTLAWLRYRELAFAHDAWVSFRRFYSPEELGLVCGLGPEGDALEATWMPPSHCLVRWQR
jgi:ubiquinone/menaquinone biosynthesis C-methylase UbiE